MIEVIHKRPLKSGYRGRCATKTKNCTCCVSRVNVFKFMTAWRNRVVVISKMFYVACVNGMSIYFSYFCHLNFVRFRIIFFSFEKRTFYNAHCVWAETASPNESNVSCNPTILCLMCFHTQKTQAHFVIFLGWVAEFQKRTFYLAFFIHSGFLAECNERKKSHPLCFTHHSAIWNGLQTNRLEL